MMSQPFNKVDLNTYKERHKLPPMPLVEQTDKLSTTAVLHTVWFAQFLQKQQHILSMTVDGHSTQHLWLKRLCHWCCHIFNSPTMVNGSGKMIHDSVTAAKTPETQTGPRCSCLIYGFVSRYIRCPSWCLPLIFLMKISLLQSKVK